MAIEYLGLSSINGPLVVLEGVQDAFYDEIVEFVVDHKIHKMGRIVELDEDKAIIQVFEGTENMSLDNTHTKLTGHPMEVDVSPEMLGRTFNGIGEPIDGLGPITAADRRDINGLPLNPVKREYPRNYIRTGISAIDGLTTLIRGQKLPIFSGNGLPHDQLAETDTQAFKGELGSMREAGITRRRFGRGVCGCIWRYGCQTRRGRIFPQNIRRERCIRSCMYVPESCE